MPSPQLVPSSWVRVIVSGLDSADPLGLMVFSVTFTCVLPSTRCFAVKALVAAMATGWSGTLRAVGESFPGRNKGARDRVPEMSAETAAQSLARTPDARMLPKA
ncbi:hypothetical protein CmmCFBP4999_14995 [Clavibacter michiganensis subsp. michiganensis]|nr:hypothetical protein B5P23_15850 [Clavibacter michiganensis subsp. michiganensis]QGV76782.1 hypothetical protein EFE39_15575 [Clavibacter michiganensis subsp. michiganensis]RMC85371.1 hypothetical protein CmmCFBP4999_14995 [Clavibacter michiganensis subsp. michiganensis]